MSKDETLPQENNLDRLTQYNSQRYNSEVQTDVSMLPEKDQAVIKTALNKEWTNPRYKLRWFVGQAQITPFAKMRQYLMEIKSKEESIENMEYEIAKLEVEYDRFKRLSDQANDDLDRRLYDVEKWNAERNVYMSKRRLQDWYLERQTLIDLYNEFMASDEAYLPDGSGRTYMDILNTKEEDVYEAEYWTNRLAKQAATDMLFYGRINGGNMDAILMMPPEQQAETLALTVNYSTKLKSYQTQLEHTANEQLKLGDKTWDDLKSLAQPGGIENKKLVEEKPPVPNGKTVHNFDDNTSKQINNSKQKKDGDLLDNVYPV